MGNIIGKILVVLLLLGCAPSKELVKIYPIQQVEITKEKSFGQEYYRVDYYIHFTPNIKRYWIDYWKEVNGEWEYVDNLVQNIKKNRAKKSIGIREHFIVTKPSRIKIKIKAYNTELKHNSSGITLKREHIFDVK